MEVQGSAELEPAESLAFRSVAFDYGQRPVLRDVSFGLSVGTTGLLGVNGAGKTTLLRLAVGDLVPKSGSVELAAAGRRLPAVGYCPQRVSLPGGLSVRELFQYLAWLRGIPSHARSKSVDDAIEWADIASRRDDRLGALSGGMFRRVILAQALIGCPEVILLDEPTTGLDPEQRTRVRQILKNLPSSASILMSSHIIEDLASLASRTMILHEGELVEIVDMAGQTSESLEALFLKTISRTR